MHSVEYSGSLVRALLMALYDETRNEELARMKADVVAALNKLPLHHRRALTLVAQGYTARDLRKLFGGTERDTQIWLDCIFADLVDAMNGMRPMLTEALAA